MTAEQDELLKKIAINVGVVEGDVKKIYSGTVGSYATSATINVSSLLSNYKNMQISNFIFVPTRIGVSGCAGSGYGSSVYGVKSSVGSNTISLSYNNITGIITANGIGNKITTGASGVYYESWVSGYDLYIK